MVICYPNDIFVSKYVWWQIKLIKVYLLVLFTFESKHVADRDVKINYKDFKIEDADNISENYKDNDRDIYKFQTGFNQKTLAPFFNICQTLK